MIWNGAVWKSGTSRWPFAVGISGFQQLHRGVSAVPGRSRTLANRALPAGESWDGTVQAPVGADNALSGRFTEEEPEEASSLLNLRPCRIRYDVTKEWTNIPGLERGPPGLASRAVPGVSTALRSLLAKIILNGQSSQA